MDGGRAPVSWRPATPADAVALRDLEREANLVALHHVFGDRPFPDGEVLARWQALLADPAVTVLLRPEALTSWDAAGRLRHLAVHPDHWGCGLGREGVELAEAAIRAVGRTPTLWVLRENHRARRLYERLGWEPTGETQPAEFPPYPEELLLRGSDRGR